MVSAALARILRPRIAVTLAALSLALGGRSDERDHGINFTVVARDITQARIDGATIRLSSIDRALQIKCGADGSAVFANLVPGTYDVEVFAQGFLPQTFHDIRAPRSDLKAFEVTLQVGSSSEQCGTMNLVDYDNSRLWRIPVSGRIKEEDRDEPVRGARVDLFKTGEKRAVASTRSDKNGNFTFASDNLAAGRYDVQVRKDAYWTMAVKGFLAPRESSAVLTIFTDKRDHIHMGQ